MPEDSEVRIGVDVGGTFTDLVTVRDGRLRVDKTPSTPDAPERGVLNGVDAARDRGLDPAAVAAFAHGTTVATNAALEGEWAEAALLTTAGFRDAIEIGRQDRPDLYDFRAEKPEPVVPRNRRYGVPGRLDERGEELEPLAEDRVREVASEISGEVDAVAVAYLFAFENADHERRTRELLRKAGVDVPISLSAEVLPEIREYERSLSTALNAALEPVMGTYLDRLAAGVRGAGIDAPVSVMQSNGGVVDAAVAADRPVDTLLSGPAAGVQGAAFVAGQAGHDDLVTMDMGGTSTDVSLVTDGEPPITTETTVADYPVSVPTVDIHTVGAGGGSIARIDAGGALRVGPASAGAQPGPVCYGRGGERPTITDAHALLGRIDPGAFVADLDVDERDVEAAFEPIADELDVSVREAAAGVLDVADASMERALRVVSVERGHDPRRFALVAFGGAGPLHAGSLADALDMPEVVIPRTAGVLSALGLLVSDVTYDYSTTRVRDLSAVSPEAIERVFAEFETEARERLADEGFSEPAVTAFDRRLALRYAGQSFDLSVPVADGLNAGALEAAADRFHETHRERYGHAYPEEPLELVTVRLRARGLVDPPDLSVTRDGDPDDAIRTDRSVLFGGDEHATPVYVREQLPTGTRVDGPAIVEGTESTIVIEPGQVARIDDDANLLLEPEAER